MELSNMKNMVILRNLPSNMVEEAIVIFKESQRIKEKELIDSNNKNNLIEPKTKSKEYILKEAEMLITDYINNIENKKDTEKSSKNIKNKYKNLKKCNVVLTILLVISLIINFI